MRKYIVFLLLFVLLFSLFACASNRSIYAKWALPQNYMFSVGIDDFDGDNYRPGTFIFSEMYLPKSIPVIWDVYVSDSLYTRISDLLESSYIGSVGGIEKSTLTVDIPSSSYVYIVYNDVLGEMKSELIIEMPAAPVQ